MLESKSEAERSHVRPLYRSQVLEVLLPHNVIPELGLAVETHLAYKAAHLLLGQSCTT